MSCILVVDDFEDTRSLYAAFLRTLGHDVLEASDGEAALRIAGAELPDVIVMDLSMPVLDGWEAIDALRADKRTCHIPIVAVSGDASAKRDLKARGLEVDAFIAKPCRHDALAARVEELLASSPFVAFPRAS